MRDFSKKSTAPKKWFSDQISITGDSGTGTSTLLSRLKQRLGNRRWQFHSAGELMREFARELRMSVELFSEYRRNNPQENWDERCDCRQESWGLYNFVCVDGRQSQVRLPHAFHIKVVCSDLELRATRRKKHPKYSKYSIVEIMRMIEKRDEDDRAIYEILYPGSNWPAQDFDCIIDTSLLDEQEMVDKALEDKNEWGFSKKPGELVYHMTMS